MNCLYKQCAVGTLSCLLSFVSFLSSSHSLLCSLSTLFFIFLFFLFPLPACDFVLVAVHIKVMKFI